ncbi:acyltransferase family protein [Photobacterium swingsii]|uniref:acyltransferase family protein n=1 Tax=Photobacterium swingsii TaxID=680026 RepID=UPI00352CD36B
MQPIKYRADVDGLRAVAVIAVILFHLNPAWLPGGFVGVDVFFVISGFIITTSLYPSIDSNVFSFSDFYIKRIKRILPLFYLVVFSSLIVAYILFLPNDLINYADSMRYASGFIANIYFEKQSGYFAPTSDSLPLLHIWSLSLEEQFYFIWPILLLCCTKLFAKQHLLKILVASFIGLVCYSQYSTLMSSSSAYYLLQSRGFELLGGAILAIASILKRERNIHFSPFTHNLVGMLGFASIITMFITYHKGMLFPGFSALWVVLVTSLIIFSGERQDSRVFQLLSHRKVVFVGTLSYSLYLWHWPVLAFYRYFDNSFTFSDMLLCITLIIVLSLLSWKFVEKPLRHTKIQSRWVVLFYLVLPIALSISIAKNIVENKGYADRFPNDVVEFYQVSLDEFKFHKDEYKVLEGEQPFQPTLLGIQSDEQQNLNAFLWGDSHGGHFRSAVDILGKEYGFSALYGGLGGCPPLLGASLLKGGKPETRCTDNNNELAKVIAQSTVKYVFLAGRWSMYTETTRAVGERGSRVYLGMDNDYSESIENSRQTFSKSLEATVKFLIENGKVPIIFDQAPAYDFNPSNCWLKKSMYESFRHENCDIPQEEVNKRQKAHKDIFSQLAKKYSEIIIINTQSVLCDGNICKSKLDGIPLYNDNNHLSYEGARILIREYLQQKASSNLKATLEQ